jgi:hypothetical protein
LSDISLVSSPSGRVTYHKKVMAGACLILLLSIYPAAPATMHPTAKPIMILIFFRNGEPNISVMIIVIKERNPRPINSGEPHLNDRSVPRTMSVKEEAHGRGLGAKIVGQS